MASSFKSYNLSADRGKFFFCLLHLGQLCPKETIFLKIVTKGLKLKRQKDSKANRLPSRLATPLGSGNTKLEQWWLLCFQVVANQAQRAQSLTY